MFNCLWARRVRKSPFLKRALNQGSRLPVCIITRICQQSYGDPDAEYNRLINGVAVWDVAVERRGGSKRTGCN